MANEQAVARARISGLVQGVGFRPFTAALARRFGLFGFVRNDGGTVFVEACGPKRALDAFFGELRNNPPLGARVESLQIEWESRDAAAAERSGFVIAKSGKATAGRSIPAPDIAVCPECLRELTTPGGPRYRNPFISCTLCGPRFSIMRALPYDRETTSMAEFALCPLCESQYADPGDRRCHAQTICCNHCGPRLFYRAKDGAESFGEEALHAAAGALTNGQTVAIKGIGGYHLACDPFDEAAVRRLRRLKLRESKPFAVMFLTMEQLRQSAEADSEEEALLCSRARPIVLLRQRADRAPAREVGGGSPRVGAFLPYAPLQYLLLEQTGPLVMTSANLTSLPIMKEDDEVFALLERSPLLAGVLYHNRAIVRRLDDSVAEVADGAPRILRRARGYAPLPVDPPAGTGDCSPGGCEVLLAYGPQQKSSVCLGTRDALLLGPEAGDLDSEQALAAYRRTLADLPALMGAAPSLAVCDLHPRYESTRLAAESGLPVAAVQHHVAHIGSVMAEHGLTGPVLGAALDGTGYGPDHTVWGGEFLVVCQNRYRRVGHIKPVLLPAFDRSVLRGDLTARCLLIQAGVPLAHDPDTALLAAAVAGKVNMVRSSSMGRWFDAVSALLGICAVSDYEGRCAVELENAAQAYRTAHPQQRAEPFAVPPQQQDGVWTGDFLPVLRTLYDLRGRQPSGLLAWRFHETVLAWIVNMCTILGSEHGLKELALSGGVFANRLLLDGLLPALRRQGFTVYINRQVPPGDGGVALGQAYLGRFYEPGKPIDCKGGYTPCVLPYREF